VKIMTAMMTDTKYPPIDIVEAVPCMVASDRMFELDIGIHAHFIIFHSCGSYLRGSAVSLSNIIGKAITCYIIRCNCVYCRNILSH
jgi:hypothetical protein